MYVPYTRAGNDAVETPDMDVNGELSRPIGEDIQGNEQEEEPVHEMDGDDEDLPKEEEEKDEDLDDEGHMQNDAEEGDDDSNAVALAEDDSDNTDDDADSQDLAGSQHVKYIWKVGK